MLLKIERRKKFQPRKSVTILDVVRWTKKILDFLSRIPGPMNEPLACIARATDIVDYAAPFMLTNQAFYAEDAGYL